MGNYGIAGDAPQERKSLMNSLEKLASRANQLEEVERLSEKLVEKLERTEGMAKPCGNTDCEKSAKIPTIIDLFNGVSDKQQVLINQILSNLEREISMIE